ncbi:MULTISPECIES: hypothetical protein [unclassified Sinorhizobium]|uniref:hypothetical protein n=1 Tax=unclassified Sinorhizobium TaxID=2613772 RepID=UPI0024C2AEFE|nr:MULTISPECIES: hypothetical protein [unclassified Sinorhizobium]MDK1374384.1 hypothetical protein [Sinorhizobium sp. 6-70]MDK1478963.1 hypothetical protein [Sinorhizobium sp. 6-117]
MENIEFRLAAHREILVAVLSALAKNDDAWLKINRILEEELIVQDHEEDPGIVPSGAFARQNAMAAEISSILQDASARAAADASPATPKNGH